MVVAATEGTKALKEYTLFQAGSPPWGEAVVITVKRGTKLIDVRAKAPTLMPQ